MEPVPHIVIRLFYSALLCFFAFAPCWIAFWTIPQVLAAPISVGYEAHIALSICIPMAYFLLLLAWRAFTWRGRSPDGALVPPLAMLIFAVVFGFIGIALMYFTAMEGSFIKLFAAAAYVYASTHVSLATWKRWRDA